jgi:hypothetical protein
MLIDSSHRNWIVTTLILALLASAGYASYAVRTPGGPSGGSIPGLIFGTAGSGLMLFAGLLSARKRAPTWRIGRAQTWLKGHIWLGLLSVPLLLFHSGFRWGGTLENWLWLLFGLIIVSGLFGLAVQQFLPRMMTIQVPLETIYEQIPHICGVLQIEADALVERVCGPAAGAAPADEQGKGKRKPKGSGPVAGSEPVREFYLRQVRPYLGGRHDRHSPLAMVSRASAAFARVKTLVPPELHETLDQLAAFCDERRQLALQTRLHHWLHGWLFVHLPLSVALLVLGIVHAWTSLWY